MSARREDVAPRLAACLNWTPADPMRATMTVEEIADVTQLIRGLARDGQDLAREVARLSEDRDALREALGGERAEKPTDNMPEPERCAICNRVLEDDDHKTSEWKSGYAHDECIFQL